MLLKFYLLSVGLELIFCQEVGEECTLNTKAQIGTCRIHSDCPGIEEHSKKHIPIVLCGFYELTTPIVCCQHDQHRPVSPNDLVFEEDVSIQSGHNHNNMPGDFLSGTGRKSQAKCLEYNKAVTDSVQAIPLVTNIDPITINVSKCQYNSVALIVGGTPADKGEFPFMVAIGFPDSDDAVEWRCGGTLISDKWVLTAAHCIASRGIDSPKWIRMGASDMSKDEEYGRSDYRISAVIHHPNYKYPLKYHDIALLATDRKVQLSKFVRPACLYLNSDISERVVIAAGWGQTDYFGSTSEKLLKVQLSIYDNNVCQRAYQKEITTSRDIPRGILNSMICAGDLAGGRDTCLGDSGGPLFVTEKENMCKFYVLGITSFGKLCAQANIPAIYTRVSQYIEWIESIVW